MIELKKKHCGIEIGTHSETNLPALTRASSVGMALPVSNGSDSRILDGEIVWSEIAEPNAGDYLFNA